MTSWMHAHPWMTFFLVLATLSAIGRVSLIRIHRTDCRRDED